jgi:hypothetical protein
MKTHFSMFLTIALAISGCAAKPSATPTPSQIAPTPTFIVQQPTATVPVSIPATNTATPEVEILTATATPEPTATTAVLMMEIVGDSGQSPVPQPQSCQRPMNWVSYTVQLSDTLSSLGQRTGTGWQQIQSANCLTSTMIFAGQILLLPFIPAPPVVIMEVPSVETPEPPAPGNPSVSVKPATGVIPAIYTFEIRDFTASEFVTVKVWPVGAIAALASFRVRIGGDGNLDFPWISQSGNPTGNYFVIVANDDESHKAVGEFVVE